MAAGTTSEGTGVAVTLVGRFAAVSDIDEPDIDEPDIDEQGRPEPPLEGDELTTLLGFLEFQRATLAWKCRGVDAAGLDLKVPPSVLTLGGLLKHMALVESSWFERWLHGGDYAPPFDAIDWDADPNWEFESAAADAPGQLLVQWEEAVERSRASVVEALAHGDLSQKARRTWPDGRSPNLRWILVHMIEEYARHNGHADFLREAVDGETGE
jgi:uncharacterized damage-inducible protein DinB